MPELPEVENIAIGLRNIMQGQILQRAEVHSPVILKGPGQDHWPRFFAELSEQRVEQVTRRAKRLQLIMESGVALVVQLGMTGKFLQGQVGEEAPGHTHMTLTLDNDTQVYYVDARRFGRVWLFDHWDDEDHEALMERAGMGRLGPDALDMRLAHFVQILHTPRPVKALLLDQTRIAGLGNIYVDESLFATGLLPTRAADDCLEEAGALLKNIKSVLRRAIKAGGTTFSDYRNAYGDMGRFRQRLKVYGRQGQPCRQCGTTLERRVVAGRGSHVCPECQR